MWPKHPASDVIDSATYLLTISSPDIDNVAMSLNNIILMVSPHACVICVWSLDAKHSSGHHLVTQVAKEKRKSEIKLHLQTKKRTLADVFKLLGQAGRALLRKGMPLHASSDCPEMSIMWIFHACKHICKHSRYVCSEIH